MIAARYTRSARGSIDASMLCALLAGALPACGPSNTNLDASWIVDARGADAVGTCAGDFYDGLGCTDVGGAVVRARLHAPRAIADDTGEGSSAPHAPPT